MPGWRQFLAKHDDDNFEIISIALDHDGPEAARPFAEAAGPDIPTLVDAQGKLASHFGFYLIPNGYFIDEEGLLVYARHGFSVDNEEDVETVRRFVATGDTPESGGPKLPYTLEPADYKRIGQLMSESQEKRASGDVPGAAVLMRRALRMDPGNFTIRKQIWSLEHPERFYPAIDFDWQKVRIAEEHQREIEAGWFDADGQFVPPQK